MKLNESWTLKTDQGDFIDEWDYRPNDQEIEHVMSQYEPGTKFILSATIELAAAICN